MGAVRTKLWQLKYLKKNIFSVIIFDNGKEVLIVRLNYYRFPEDIDPDTRYRNGAARIDGVCRLNRDSCKDCPHGWWDECKYWFCTEAEDIIEGCSVSHAKELLKKFGGYASTQHCQRDGTAFDVTEIILTGNNSRFKYSRHL